MSNVIPIVSSSPPPLDDDAGFGWEEDDDDFGNFTSAPSIPAGDSGSSTTVNWSESETSLPQNDGSNKNSPLKSGSNFESDEKENDFRIVDSHSVSPPPPAKVNSLNRDSENDDDFQDFAQFDQDSSPEENNEPLPGSSPEESNQLSSRSSHVKTDMHSESLVSESNSNSEAVDTTETDEFHDFAQFSDVSMSDKHLTSPLGTEDLPVETTNTDSENVHPDTNHSRERDDSSSPEHELDSAATDSQTSMSIVVKNNESLYSNASIIDSGVFSADLSPSSQPSNLHEHNDTTEDKTSSLETSSDVTDIPFTHSISSDVTPQDGVLQQIDNEDCAENTSPSNSPDETKSASQNCSQIIVPAGDTFAHGEEEDWSDFNSTLASDNAASHDENDQTEHRVSDHDLHNPTLTSHEHSQHSSSHHSSDLNSETLPVPPSADPADSEPNDADHEEKAAENIEENGSDQQAGDSYEIHNVNKDSGDVSQDATDEAWGDFDSGMIKRDDGNDVGENETKDGELCNTNSSVVDSQTDTKEEFNTGDTGLISSSQPDRSGENMHTALPDMKNGGEIAEENGITETEGNTIEQKGPQKDIALQQEGGEEEMDKEFGDFSSHRERKESDAHEIAPITFRKSICEDSEVGNSDDDFSFERERTQDNKSEDFDAFGTFNDDENDDFGDFDSAQNVPESSSKADDNDDFGEFGSSGPSADGDAGWADFEAAPTADSGQMSASTDTDSQPKVTGTAPDSKQDKAQKVRLAIVSCFPENTQSSSSHADHNEDTTCGDGVPEDGNHHLTPLQNDESLSSLETVVELGLSNAVEAKQQTWTVVQHPSKKDPKVRLWSQLRDVDSSHALMYGWPASHCSKEVFSTLHIDTLNVLFTQKKQAVPFFASGLSILEPVRGGSSAAGIEGKREKKSMPPLQPALLDTSSGQPQPAPSSAAQDIPPVDFDWSSSGLTNPLTANTLDLDFLVVQGSDTCEKISDEWDWVFKADCEESARPSLQPLEDILKKSTPTVKLATHEVVSPEAQRILEKMQDLSFMQSPVLMFPIKQ